MKKILLILTTIFFFNISLVFAETCSLSEKNELSAYASNVKAGYTVETQISVDKVEYYIFNIYIKNITSDIYAIIREEESGLDVRHEYTNENKGQYQYVQSFLNRINKYKVTIYGKKNGCKDKLLRTISFDTPKNNEYQMYPMCNDIPEYVLCQPFYNFDLGYDTFVKRTTEYKASLLAKKNSKVTKDELGNAEKVWTFFVNNKVIIVSITIVLLAGVGIIVYKYVSKKGKKII